MKRWFAMVALFLAGCVPGGTGTETPNGSGDLDHAEGDIVFLDTFNPDSLGAHSAFVGIDSAWMEGEVLHLAVVSGGGCVEKHDYTLYGAKAVLKSEPPQAELFLSEDNHGDMCDALLYRRLEFRIGALKLFGTGTIDLRIHRRGTEVYLPMPRFTTGR